MYSNFHKEWLQERWEEERTQFKHTKEEADLSDKEQ